MQTVLLVVLLILALALIGVVLLQRSEGGGLGMGAGGAISGRAQATALGKATWWLGAGFMLACLLMTVIAAEQAGGRSVVDRIQDTGADAPAVDPTTPDLDGSLLPPPVAGTGGALLPADEGLVPTDTPPAADVPTTDAPAEAPATEPEAAAPAEAPAAEAPTTEPAATDVVPEADATDPAPAAEPATDTAPGEAPADEPADAASGG